MNNWCIYWFSRIFLLGILIYKGFNARRLYKLFDVKGLKKGSNLESVWWPLWDQRSSGAIAKLRKPPAVFAIPVRQHVSVRLVLDGFQLHLENWMEVCPETQNLPKIRQKYFDTTRRRMNRQLLLLPNKHILLPHSIFLHRCQWHVVLNIRRTLCCVSVTTMVAEAHVILFTFYVYSLFCFIYKIKWIGSLQWRRVYVYCAVRAESLNIIQASLINSILK
jgi:hypothetical protein